MRGISGSQSGEMHVVAPAIYEAPTRASSSGEAVTDRSLPNACCTEHVNNCTEACAWVGSRPDFRRHASHGSTCVLARSPPGEGSSAHHAGLAVPDSSSAAAPRTRVPTTRSRAARRLTAPLAVSPRAGMRAPRRRAVRPPPSAPQRRTPPRASSTFRAPPRARPGARAPPTMPHPRTPPRAPAARRAGAWARASRPATA